MRARGRSPVLLLGFNRPENTKRVLEAISALAVPRLYVSLDGPRAGRPQDVERCELVLQVVQSRDWAEEVIVQRAEGNLGCRQGVTTGLDWFFANEPEGIVLEDDCLPGPDFLPFCDRMLAQYRDDERIWQVSGSNLLGSWRPRRSDHFFGDGGIWGWASWARAWKQRDMAMHTWGDPAARERARRFLGPIAWRHLAPNYAAVAEGRIDTWDYQWSWTRASNEGLSVIPARNLVTNIGFGPDATHTLKAAWPAAMAATQLPPAPLASPKVKFDRCYQSVLSARAEGLGSIRAHGARLLRRLRPMVASR